MTNARSILVVEDEMVISMELAGTLKRLGYQIAGQLISGEEAIARAGELSPDLILMDIRLKGEIDGIEAAKQIGELYDIPVVFLTAHSDDTTLHRAIAIQPSGYLIKPFNDRELYSTIELSLYKHDLRLRLRPSGIIETGFSEIPDDVPCLFVSRDFMILAATKAAGILFSAPVSSMIATKLDSWICLSSGKAVTFPETVQVNTKDNQRVPVTITLGFLQDQKTRTNGLLLFFSRRDEPA